MKILPKTLFFSFVYWVNALLYGLVYFYPYKNGEPFIPIYYKLLYDLLLVFTILIFGFKKKVDEIRLFFLLFLLTALCIGLLHVNHTGINDYLHYTIRNIIFYSLIFYVNFFGYIDLSFFHKLHYKVFKVVLCFGMVLFLFKILGIKNPFGFNYWFWENNRLISSWLNPNSLGFYLLFYLIFEYYKSNGVTLIFLLTALSIFLTGSFTAMIGLVLFIAYIFIKLLQRKKIRPIYLISFILSIPIGIYIGAITGVFEYLFFKMDVLFVSKNTTYTSVSTRVQNIHDLINYLSLDNLPSIILGDFSIEEYARLDSQYLNIFYNYGIIGLILYSIPQFLILIKLYNGKTIYSKTMLAFCLWLFFIAFNLTAYLYRPNIIFFFYVMLAYIFSLESSKGYHKQRIITE